MTPVNRIPVKSPADAARRATAGLPIPPNDLKAMESTVYELCLNVQQWADGPGEVSVERDDSHMIITVQDEGVGIPATMRKAFPDLDDEAAVVKALEAGGVLLRRTLARVRARGRGRSDIQGLCRIPGKPRRRGLDQG